ncbi:hypothetical protein HYU14_02445 [Candidatus Woesearchaeota archaeon]|nr:hypothetical protein [Candidatus Woesearchaeota archaeon]
MGCRKCMGVSGAIFLVLGLLFLLVDLGIWDFWGIQWWSAVLIVLGIGKLAMKTCPDCMAIATGKKK